MARFIVAFTLIVVVLAILFAASGLLRVENSPDHTTITLDKAQLRETGREALQKTEDAGRRLADRVDEGARDVSKDLQSALGDGQSRPQDRRAADQRTHTSPPEDRTR